MPDESDLRAIVDEFDELRAALDRLRGAILLRTEAPGPLLDEARSKMSALRRELRLAARELAEFQTRNERTGRELWDQKVRRADATARANYLHGRLTDIEKSGIWKTLKPFWKLATRRQRKQAARKVSSDLVFDIEAPVEWRTEAEITVIRGWCFAPGGRQIAGVRAKIGRKSRFAHYGLERRDVFENHQDVLAARHCGFSIDLRVPGGKTLIELEAIEQGGDWVPFFKHELYGVGTQSAEVETSKSASDRVLARFPRITADAAVSMLKPLFREHAQRLGDAAPRFSVITPTFNTTPQWFAEAAVSLLQQSSPAWEWCVVDDGSSSEQTRQMLKQLSAETPRLKIELRSNAGISVATNAALDLATAEFVCFLDHDDLLDAEAFSAVTKAIDAATDVIYSDEDKLQEPLGGRVEPFFKPDWSPEYFRGVMYVGHLLCVRRELAQGVRFDPAFDGIQDFEFMLRVSETGARIRHLPKVLYHWRKTPGSIADDPAAKPKIDELQQRAVNAHLHRSGLPAQATFSGTPHRLRIVPAKLSTPPRVSIIVPTKDAADLLERCLTSIFGKSSYSNFEVVLVDNETTDESALRVMGRFTITRIEFPGRFNFSRANNQGARSATGSFLVFLNNDTEIISEGWLEQLVYYAAQSDVGAVGGLLTYEDGTVQHAGVALGMRGTADHVMRGFPRDVDGYAGSLICAREVSAVTAACMMVRKELFEELGGFNEHFFTAYQDVDLCLRLRERGLRNIYTPGAVAVHHESVSRQNYYDMIDRMLLLDRWEEVIARGDPYYNRNLDLARGDYSVARNS